jgi:putative N6-adenine-specific DNA methylase
MSAVSLFLPCAAGVEPLLAEEVRALLHLKRTPPTARGGVALQASLRDAMALNLGSRLAQRVLLQVAHGPYRHEDDLYELARTVNWPAWITPQQTLRVDSTARQSPLRSLNFANLRIKDAVCDALREASGARPSVDTRHPHLALALHLEPELATLYVDTSGEPLFKRGWRDAQGQKGEAPLKETLAAAMLAAAGWHGRAEDGALLDPCCGAGTIAIEAAQIACGMAPGLKRRFAFERLTPFASLKADWAAMKQAAQAAVHAPAVAIYAGDVSFRMTDFAQRNAERAGVGQAIQFKTADALQRPAPADAGVMLLNPPYGERIAPKGRGAAANAANEAAEQPARSGREQAEGAENIDAFFSQLATHWKRAYAGWTAWVLSPDAKLPQRMRLKESRRVPLWNGPIECRLLKFELVAGSNRARPAEAGPAA